MKSFVGGAHLSSRLMVFSCGVSAGLIRWVVILLIFKVKAGLRFRANMALNFLQVFTC